MSTIVDKYRQNLPGGQEGLSYYADRPMDHVLCENNKKTVSGSKKRYEHH